MKEEKLFGLSLDKDYIEVVTREGRFFVRHDVDSVKRTWREDEITRAEVDKIGTGIVGEYQVMFALRRRLGAEAFKSNWGPK